MKKKMILLISILLLLLLIFGKYIYFFLTDLDYNRSEKIINFLCSHIKIDQSLVTLDGITLIPYGEYDEIASHSPHGCRRVKKNNKYGFIDNNTGKIIISCKYEVVCEFVKEITLYKDTKTGNFGYINKKDQIIIKPIYSTAENFSHLSGLAKISIDDEHYGYLNEKGKIVIPLEYTFLGHFNSLGYAEASIYNEFDGYIDKNNKKYEGQIPTENIANKEFIIETFCKNNKYGVKDKENKIILEPKFKNIYIDYYSKGIIVRKGFLKFAVYDFTGKQISKDFISIGLGYSDKNCVINKLKIVL